jgi:glyoxylase I family protein
MAGERTIDAGTPESRQMAEGVRRAVRCTERLNALPYDDRERIAAAWGELTGHRRQLGSSGRIETYAPSATRSVMERVVGVGALFVRARDPEALMRWYEEHLGFTEEGPELPLRQPGLGRTVCPFPQDTDYFGRAEQAWMLNFRVRDLDAMLAQLRDAGVDVSECTEEHDYGRFGWAHDLEGNRFELWEPS